MNIKEVSGLSKEEIEFLENSPVCLNCNHREGLHNNEKVYIKRKLTLIIQKYILKDLWVAIAKDILTQESIKVDSHVYVYLNKHVFHGNTRKFLVFLQDVLDNER